MAEAKEIQDSSATFLGTELKLPLAAEKTLITQALTKRARFRGYAIKVLASPTQPDRRGQRRGNGKVGMYIPEDVMLTKRTRDMRDGKAIHRPARINDSAYDLIIRYQGAYRGLVHDYGLAHNLAQLSDVRWTMEPS